MNDCFIRRSCNRSATSSKTAWNFKPVRGSWPEHLEMRRWMIQNGTPDEFADGLDGWKYATVRGLLSLFFFLPLSSSLINIKTQSTMDGKALWFLIGRLRCSWLLSPQRWHRRMRRMPQRGAHKTPFFFWPLGAHELKEKRQLKHSFFGNCFFNQLPSALMDTKCFHELLPSITWKTAH